MAFNLVEEPWIPIRTSDGQHTHIAPWQITARIHGAPVVALDSPRADFNGALIQFLIGLVQTSGLAPEMEIDWDLHFESPFSSEVLHEVFSDHKDAFNLDGEFPRFLQDLTMEDGNEFPISHLLIDLSGNQHFIKPQEGDGFCFACAATALFCLQTNSPKGGRGHLTGLRGGGPLTSLVLPPAENLWQTVWLNVVSQEDLEGAAGHDHPDAPDDIFPWLPTRTAEKKTGRPTYPGDAHPLQIYWSMPRRIRLDCANLGQGYCDVCGQASDKLVQRYYTKPYGVKYEGNWVHPLSPYFVDKQGVHSALKAREGSINYRNWIGLVLKSSASSEPVKVQRLPAQVVYLFIEKRQKFLGYRDRARLWGFGYDMDDMRARCWFEGRMPIPALPDDRISKEYIKRSERMVTAASAVGRNLRVCLREAWFRYTANIRGDTGFVDAAYWSRSEAVFFEHLHKLISELQESYPAVTDQTLDGWHKYLCWLALELFDEYVTSGPIEDEDPARIARSRNKLKAWNRGKSVTEKILHLSGKTVEADRP